MRQHYLDFLAREPDQSGLDYWTAQITQCGADAPCINRKRIDVSAAFFIETEFQDSGYFVYRFYKGLLGRQPGVIEFMNDRAQVVGGANLEASKQGYALGFVQRSGFLSRYPRTMTAGQFVDALLATVLETSSVDLSSERSRLISLYDGTDQGRAAIVRQTVDNQGFIEAEYNRAFVLMQYFGYLRREIDQAGYDSWLNVLNNNEPGNFRGMVCSFITSAEYQMRFGFAVTRTNAQCAQ